MKVATTTRVRNVNGASWARSAETSRSTAVLTFIAFASGIVAGFIAYDSLLWRW